MRFEGRGVIVTGGGSGIGAEMVRLFLEEGAQVLAADLDTAGVPAGALARATDVSDPDDVEAMVSAAREAFGHVDALCNNAGIGSTTDVIAATLEEWERVFTVNTRGTFLGIKAVLPSMLNAGTGAIVNTASVAGMIGLRDRASYSASKGAIIALTKQVAVQYAGTGVRCNCICPGTVDSPWVAGLMAQADDPAERRAQLTARQPVGRLGEPTEIAKAAVYLASDDADFVTGSTFVIDGGLTAA